MDARPKRRWFRFSLLTLVILVLLIGSGMGVWHSWEPWYVSLMLRLGSEESLRAATFSPDGTQIAVLGDTHVRLWEAATGKLSAVLPLDSAADYAPTLDFSPDGTLVMAASKREPGGDTIFHVWNAHSGAKRAAIVSDEAYSYRRGFSYDGQQIQDWFHLCFWNIADGRKILSVGLATLNYTGCFPPPTPEQRQKIEASSMLATFAEHVQGLLVRSTVSGNRRVAATNIMDAQNTEVWDLADGRKRCDIPASDWDFNLSHDGALLSTWSSSRAAFIIWDTRSGTLLRSFPGNTPRVRTFSNSGNLFACASADGMLRVWDAHDGTLRCSTAAEFPDKCVFFPDDSRLALVRVAAGSECVIELRDSANGKLLATLLANPEYNLGAYTFAIAPNGRQIVAPFNEGSTDCEVAVWSRRRPEYCWGIAWLPEFWLTVVFAGAFVWSVWRDRRTI